MKWKEEFKNSNVRRFICLCPDEDCVRAVATVEYIESLLEEQRKELSNRKMFQLGWSEGYNQGVAVGVVNG